MITKCEIRPILLNGILFHLCHLILGDFPKRPSGGCAAVINDSLFLFGGNSQNQVASDLLYELNLLTKTWKNRSNDTSGEKPSRRNKFGCWVKDNEIIYFGGYGHPPANPLIVSGDFTFRISSREIDGDIDGFGWNNHIFSLDTVNMQWKQPKCSGDIPCPRAAFASAQIGVRGYLFGGRYKDERRNDLYMIDLQCYKWIAVQPRSKIRPQARSWTVLTPVNDEHLFLYGGLDNDDCELKDIWLFSIKQESWIELPNLSEKLGCFSRRVWHSANATNTPGEVIVFGGSSNFKDVETNKNSEDVETNKLAIFHFVPPKLKTLCIDHVLCILEQDAETWMPNIVRLPRALAYDISSKLPVQKKDLESSEREELATTKCFPIFKIIHRKFWKFRSRFTNDNG